MMRITLLFVYEQKMISLLPPEISKRIDPVSVVEIRLY